MNGSLEHIDELIGKYLADEASAGERMVVESWINASDSNRKYFLQFKTIFDHAAKVDKTQQFDADTAWNNVKRQLHQKEGRTLETGTSSGSVFWRVAAAISFVLLAGYGVYRLITPDSPLSMEVVAKNATAADTLPDGSDVFLNKATRLNYIFDKRKSTHVVTLRGEAYFNIKPERDKTFIVAVDEVLIKDIGTAFNVRAYPGSDTIEVAVEDGEVMFYTEADSGLHLQAGEKGIYNRQTKTFAAADADPNIVAYKTKSFIFIDADLATVVKTLNHVYDKKITIGSSLNNCRLTVAFTNEEVEEIADIIAETLGLTAKKSDQMIILEGSGCEN